MTAATTTPEGDVDPNGSDSATETEASRIDRMGEGVKKATDKAVDGAIKGTKATGRGASKVFLAPPRAMRRFLGRHGVVHSVLYVGAAILFVALLAFLVWVNILFLMFLYSVAPWAFWLLCGLLVIQLVLGIYMTVASWYGERAVSFAA